MNLLECRVIVVILNALFDHGTSENDNNLVWALHTLLVFGNQVKKISICFTISINHLYCCQT